MKVVPFHWRHNRLYLLDQRKLPSKTVYVACQNAADVAAAIKSMVVRGAPAIGCSAAYGMALAARHGKYPLSAVRKAAPLLIKARPTAVNLAWGVRRMEQVAEKNRGLESAAFFKTLVLEAKKISEEDIRLNRQMSKWGAKLFKRGSTVLTHCNAGALATAGVGTALGVIREVYAQRKLKKVLVDETRPYLQGARLTAWELKQDGIPFELITDNMAGFFMKKGEVSAVIVGCDRVARNGDVANKIGTYSVAVLARHHRIPFYVAMPVSTLDTSCKSGRDIPIEERSPDEVTSILGNSIAPKGTRARHPAFDVTPHQLITAIICEKGVLRPPFEKKLRKLVSR